MKFIERVNKMNRIRNRQVRIMDALDLREKCTQKYGGSCASMLDDLGIKIGEDTIHVSENSLYYGDPRLADSL